MTDWKAVAGARGLQLSEAELAKLGSAMEALEPAYQALLAKLTPEIEPVVILSEEAVEGK